MNLTPPVYDFGAGIGGIGDAFTASYAAAQKKSALEKLGGQVQSGDYDGAAQTAFGAGDIQTGTALLKLGQGAKAGPALMGLLGQAGYVGAPGTAPSPNVSGQSSDAGSSSLPSFANGSGPGGSYLATLVGKESGGDPNAKNPNSSATGLGQFTDGTWASVGKAHPELGLTPDGRTDPAQTQRALTAFTADNAKQLKSFGFEPTDANLYMAHFLGSTGATRFLSGMRNNPNAPGASFVGDDQAAANRTVFYNPDGSAKSAGQVYAGLTSKFGGGSTALATPPVASPSQPAAVSSGDAPPLPPPRPSALAQLGGVQTASNDPGFVPYPTGSNPAAAAPAPAPTPQAAAASGMSPSRYLVARAAAGGTEPDPTTGSGLVPSATRVAQPPVPGAPAGSGLSPGATQVATQSPLAQLPPAAAAPAAPVAGGDDKPVIVPGFEDDGPYTRASLAAKLAKPAADEDYPTPAQLAAAQGGGGGGGPATTGSTAPAGPTPAQLSAAAPGIVQRAGLPMPLAGALNNNTSAQSRIPILMRAAMIPGLSEEQSGLVKTLLTNELQRANKDQHGQVTDKDGNVWDVNQATNQRTVALKATKDDGAIASQKLNDAITNWQKYKLPDPSDPANGTFWRDFSGKVLGGGGGVTVNTNVDAKIQSQADQELGKAKVSDVVDAINAAKPARDRLQTLATLADAWKSGDGKITTGPLGEATLKLKQFAKGSLGIDSDGLTETELVQKVGTQLAAQAAKDLTGRPTQFDFQVFLANNPGIAISPKGNLALISIMQQKARQDLALSTLARQQKNGDNWDQVVSDFETKHPIISPLTGKPLDPNEVIFPGPGGQGGAGGQGGSQGSGGATLKPIPTDTLTEARSAIRNGAPAAGVIKRLRDNGFDPSGL